MIRLRKTKLNRNKKVKLGHFPDGNREDFQHYFFYYLRNNPDSIIIHVDGNENLYKKKYHA